MLCCAQQLMKTSQQHEHLLVLWPIPTGSEGFSLTGGYLPTANQESFAIVATGTQSEGCWLLLCQSETIRAMMLAPR